MYTYLYLSLHSYTKQGNKVHYQYWPEYWNIKGVNKGAEKCYYCALRNR